MSNLIYVIVSNLPILMFLFSVMSIHIYVISFNLNVIILNFVQSHLCPIMQLCLFNSTNNYTKFGKCSDILFESDTLNLCSFLASSIRGR